MYDRFAFEQGGHFFCKKEGENLNQNWIVENLNNTDFLAGSFFVCGSRGGDFVSVTDKKFVHYEKMYHHPIVFLPTPHGLLPMKCTPEQYEQFQRDGNKLKIKPIDHGER